MSIRSPVVAGTFYPGEEAPLRRALGELIPSGPREKALAIIVPHAGYIYSGRIAGAVYGRVEIPRDVVLLCFNHRAMGKEFALWPDEGAWRTPLGEAPICGELVRQIKGAFRDAEYDEVGHSGEHSGEVQVPFLQHVRPDVRIAPVALSVGLDTKAFERLREFGRALSRMRGEFLVVASTDLNHYENQKSTIEKDQAVIGAIERLDEAALRDAVLGQDISMCGYAPVIAAVVFARSRGATSARTVMHATSGDASGDYDKVVGYVGMTLSCGS